MPRKNQQHAEGHRHQVHYFTTLKGITGMLRNPEHTESVFDIEDGLRDTEAYALALQHIVKHPATRQIVDARYLAPPADIDALGKLPVGSLGHTYARHIVDHGFDADYFRKIDVKSDLDYVLMRVRQTHDIWHVVTGFLPNRIDEIALKAFELAQLRRPMAAVIAAGGVMRYLFKDPDQLAAVLHGISMGYRLGLAAEPLLAQRWEEGFDVPVLEWRRRLNLDLAAADPDAVTRAPD
jgi:ubiquinone biosynthesis protein COQ4